MAQSVRQRHTFDEYVRLEEMSPVKHEFLDGNVWAMAGGSPEHAGIAANVSVSLGTQLRDRALSRIQFRSARSRQGNRSRHVSRSQCRLRSTRARPGRSQAADGHQFTGDRRSAEPIDGGVRPRRETIALQRIPSLEDIVLVAHDRRQLEVWHREPDGWTLDVLHDQGAVELRAIDCKLSLEEVYRNPLER